MSDANNLVVASAIAEYQRRRPPFVPTERQKDANTLMAGPQRHTGFVGGARSGKTFITVRSIYLRAKSAPGSRHAIIRFRFNAVKASIWLDTLPKVQRLCFPDTPFKDRGQDHCELPNGAEIWFLGLDEKERVEKVLGMEFATMYFNECSQIPYSSILVARTRLAQKVTTDKHVTLIQRAFYDLNPGGKGHWFNKEFVEGKDPVSNKPLSDADDFKFMKMHPKDNAANLDPKFLQSLQNLPERARRRFWDGEFTDNVDGALWSIEVIEKCRISPDQVPTLRRVVVAIDPSGSRGEDDVTRDEIGIVVAGLGDNGHAYVLADYTCRATPAEWGRRACEAYARHRADRIVAEQNFGGAMVEFVISTADSRGHISVHMVTASRGKAVRAEPISALYEQGKIHHVGEDFIELEDEMEAMTVLGYGGTGSPNRVDALVWAMTDLLGISDGDGANIIEYMRLMSAASDDDAIVTGGSMTKDEMPWLQKVKDDRKIDDLEDLTAFYKQATDQLTGAKKGCARCGEPIVGSKLSDGVNNWHPGCAPR